MTKKYIRFLPAKWDNLDFLKVCTKWTPSKHIVLFEFVNQPQHLSLDLVVARGDIKLKQDIVCAVRELKIGGFKTNAKLSEKGYNHIYVRQILNSSDYIDGDLESLQEKIKAFWIKHLPEIEKIGEAIFNLQSNQAEST